MSFDVWVGCFQNGDIATFPRAIVERAFADIADRSDPATWRLADSGGTLYIGEEAGFAVNRPPGYDEFWEAIVDVLRQTPSVLYWPGKGCVIADPSVAAHLHPDLVAAVGTPTVTTDVAEILELIRKG